MVLTAEHLLLEQMTATKIRDNILLHTNQYFLP